jgi:hypothetical protein
MKRFLAYSAVLGLFAVLFATDASAQGLKLERSVIGSGGMVAAQNNTEYSLNGVTGQFAIGTLIDQSPGSQNWDLNQGFWIPGPQDGTSVEDNDPLAKNDLFNYPNPVNRNTTIEYYLPSAAYVTLTVYDMTGNRVKVLYDGYQSGGKQTMDWDTKADNGVELSSGSYLYEVQVRSSNMAGADTFKSFSNRNIMVIVR